MTPGLIQRHHDYVLGPNQDARLASVAAGQQIIGLSLGLDSDAPFVLRSRAMRVKYNDLSEGDRLQYGLGSLLARWAGPERDYRAQTVVRQSLYAPYFGQLGNPIPVYPEVVYPKSGTITVDVKNDGAVALTNLTFYFRGVKLFAPGAVRSYQYPAQFGLLPFVYPLGTFSATDNLTKIRSVAVTQGVLRQTFLCKADADFVFRAGQSDLVASDALHSTPVNEVFITMRDEDEKPYSNDAVHLDVLWGNSGMPATYLPIGAPGALAPVGGGPNSPGLVYPEIYIPKNHLMYFDFTRADVAYAGAAAVDLTVSLIGQKVFAK